MNKSSKLIGKINFKIIPIIIPAKAEVPNIHFTRIFSSYLISS